MATDAATRDDSGSQAMENWLARLASSAPTPAGGAAAAVQAAIGAALVEMACDLTAGKPHFAEHEQIVTRTRAEACDLRDRLLELAADDAVTFDAVIRAYRMPKGTNEQQAERHAEIQVATKAAALVPLRVARVAGRILELADGLIGRSNPSVASDVGVAAAGAVAALEAAVLNVEINLVGIADERFRRQARDELAQHVTAIDVGRTVVARVRETIGR